MFKKKTIITVKFYNTLSVFYGFWTGDALGDSQSTSKCIDPVLVVTLKVILFCIRFIRKHNMRRN